MAVFNFDAAANKPLSVQVAQLTERVIELELWLGLIDGSQENAKYRCHFTTKEIELINLFLTHRDKVLTKEFAYFAIYGMLPECDQPDSKIMDIWMCRIRRKLNTEGIVIETSWGRGWSINTANHAKLLALRIETPQQLEKRNDRQ